jgi:Ca2+/Na+ antiporter
MDGLYEVMRILHNAFGGLTLLLTLAAALVLLVTARTTAQGSSLVLRADLISASVQALLGITMFALGFAVRGSAYMANLWLHYLLGIAAVGLISAMVARARRSPDGEARRYGGILLGVLVLVAITFWIGQTKMNPLA